MIDTGVCMSRTATYHLHSLGAVAAVVSDSEPSFRCHLCRHLCIKKYFQIQAFSLQTTVGKKVHFPTDKMHVSMYTGLFIQCHKHSIAKDKRWCHDSLNRWCLSLLL